MQLSQIGSFGLGKKPTEQVGTDVGTLEADNQCVDPKNENKQDEKAYLLIDDIRFCGDEFLRGYQTSKSVASRCRCNRE